MEPEQTQTDELLKEAKELSRLLAIHNSLSRRFLIGLVHGLGTAIGATLLLALLIYILSVLANFGFFSNFNTWLVSIISG